MCCKKLKELVCKFTTKETWVQPPKPSIGRLFWVMFFFGFISFLGSFGMNINTLVNYAMSEEWWYFSILLMAIILPLVPINLFSFWWFRSDSETRSLSWGLTIAHCLLMALPLRMLRMGFLAKGTKTGEAVKNHVYYLAQADLSFLRLIGVYAGSGSQLVVRIFKLFKNWSSIDSVVSESVFGTFTAVSLAMSTISLCRHSRSHRYDKQELSYASTILQVLYRACFLASRVVALACLFNLGIEPAVVTCSCLFAAFFVWFYCMTTTFTENTRQECFYYVLMAYLHIFGMFNVKDDPAKYRYAFYYSLTFFGEVFIFVTFITYIDDMYWLSVFPCIFLIGLVCHGVEHEYFHPGGRLYVDRDMEDWEFQCEHCQAEEEMACSETHV